MRLERGQALEQQRIIISMLSRDYVAMRHFRKSLASPFPHCTSLESRVLSDRACTILECKLSRMGIADATLPTSAAPGS